VIAAVLKVKLQEFLEKFHQASKAGRPNQAAKFAEHVQNLDLQIVIAERGVASLVTAVVWRYFRLGENCVEVAEALRLTSPVVRIWLYRIRHLADGVPTWQHKCGNRKKGKKYRITWDAKWERWVHTLRDKYKMLWWQCGEMIGCSWQTARYHYLREDARRRAARKRVRLQRRMQASI